MEQMFYLWMERHYIQLAFMSACFTGTNPFVPFYKVALVFEPFGDQFFHEVCLHILILDKIGFNSSANAQ